MKRGSIVMSLLFVAELLLHLQVGCNNINMWSRIYRSAVMCCASAVFCLALSSCSERADIPKDKMVNIYCEMYLADQLIDDVPGMRAQADTMSVYAPIIEKYGFTVEQFNNSVQYYLRDPERYGIMMQKVKAKLDKKEQFLTKKRNLIEGIEGVEVDSKDGSKNSSPATLDGSMPAEIKDEADAPSDTIARAVRKHKITHEKKLTRKDLEELQKKVK